MADTLDGCSGNRLTSTQNQAFNALLFLYRDVLYIELNTPRAKRAQQLPTVLSKNEVNQVLYEMQGLHRLIARLLYGCGLRLMECLRLRIKDIDFEQSQIVVSGRYIVMHARTHRAAKPWVRFRSYYRPLVYPLRISIYIASNCINRNGPAVQARCLNSGNRQSASNKVSQTLMA